MTVKILSSQELELKKQLDQVDWPIEYGIIEVQIRNGVATLATIKKTVRLD